ncbi:MAG: prolipoprotein diacylglyceryl transferase [Actinomycetaceae bacterium]|nr:prolipoprotein diacylglyceryl transferase [Actinomycetaceae bacterium]
MILSIPSPQQNIWYIGSFPLRAYAVLIIIGIIAAWFVLDRRYRKRGGPKDVSIDIAIWAVIFGIIGGRLYHVITDYQLYFSDGAHPLDAFKIWNGGLGIWGAIALGAIGAYIGAHRAHVRLAPVADALAPGLLLAQAIGRWGNYFNQELFGAPTNVPWGLEVSSYTAYLAGYDSGTTFHPTFLYESVWCLIGIAVVLLVEKYIHLYQGQLFVMYVMWYTLGRVWIEMLRIDSAHHILGLRLNVWTSIFVFVGAVGVFVYMNRKNKNVSHKDKRNDISIWLEGYEPTVKDTVLSNEEKSALDNESEGSKQHTSSLSREI